MAEHKILGLIESMARNGEVMTEQKYKEIADLLGKKVNDKDSRVCEITFVKQHNKIGYYDEETFMIRNKLLVHKQLIEIKNEEYENINNRINDDGYYLTHECILKNNCGVLEEYEFGNTENGSGTIKLINPDIVIIKIE